MDGSRFDTLIRSVHDPRSRRDALAALLAGTLGLLGLTDAVAKKRKRKRRKRKDKGKGTGQDPDTTQPCETAKQCGAGCCDSTSCFAETVSDEDRRPLSFACCPAASLCLSTTAEFLDQCCYPDETCDPTMPSRFPPGEVDTICCRSCGDSCCESFEECQGGVCIPLATARLPRTRRP